MKSNPTELELSCKHGAPFVCVGAGLGLPIIVAVTVFVVASIIGSLVHSGRPTAASIQQKQ